MNVLMIAAGQGNRLRPLTDDLPKCLLPVQDTTFFDHAMQHFDALGCQNIGVIVGHAAHQFTYDRFQYFHNERYLMNNILHSMMTARSFLAVSKTDVLVCYSDIWFDRAPIEAVMNTPGDIVVAIDQDWEMNYQDRSNHPVSEGEFAIFSDDGLVASIGKHVDPLGVKGPCGEFMGLFKISHSCLPQFASFFQSLDDRLGLDDPFQQAERWETAYMTDFFQEWIDQGYACHVSACHGGWVEVDTVQDYNKLNAWCEKG